MKIGFIGAGRVGCTMGKFLKDTGYDIVGFFDVNPDFAREAARFTGTLFYMNPEDLLRDSEMIFLTVSDSAIEQVYGSLPKSLLKGKILCHTSGAMTSSVFTDSDKWEIYGYSVHPIYAVSDRFDSYKNFHNAFITIEGSRDRLEEVRSIFGASGLKTTVISSDNKAKYHAAAATASNLVCGIYGLAERLLVESGFSEEDAGIALRGLFIDNAKGIAEKGVVAQLTGPVERNDVVTVRKHLDCMDKDDAFVYRAVSLEVLKIAKVKNPDIDYSEMYSELVISDELNDTLNDNSFDK